MPLHCAAEYGGAKMIKLLIKMGADPRKLSTIGAGVMHYAARGDNAFAITYFKTTYGFSSNEKDKFGRTPLHWATINGSKTSIQYILGLEQRDQWTSMINSLDNEGKTPLHYAILNI